MGGGKSLHYNLYFDKGRYLIDALQAGLFGFVWGKLYRREIILQYNIKMNTKWANYEDEDFNLHYLLHCKTIQTIENCNYVYFEPERGKSYKETDYIQQALEFLAMVKRMENYYKYKDFLNAWILDRFLIGVFKNQFISKQTLIIFKNELLPYISKCRMVKTVKQKRALLLSIFLMGKPCLVRIRFAFILLSRK